MHQFSKWPGLLILSSLVPLFAQASEDVDVHFTDDLVSIDASNAPVASVVQAIAAKGGLRIVQHVVLGGTVSLHLDRVPLANALDEILQNESYQLYQGVPGQPVPGTLWIFSEGSSVASMTGLFFEAVILHGGIAEKKEAIRELRRLGTPDAVQGLSLALSDEDPRVRGAAMEALAQVGGDEALAAIASATADADPWVRGEAVNALSSGDSESALQYLNLAFTDPDPNVRLAVIEAFADNPNEQSIAILSMALRDDDPMVRMHAVDALEEIGGEIAFAALMNAQSADDPDMQEAVEESLSSLMLRP